MTYPQPEHRRTKISADVQSSPVKLQQLAAAHPFTCQIDVIFPFSDVLESALSKLETRYYAGRIRLSDIADEAFADRLLEPEKSFLLLGTDRGSDDAWCIDNRGLLTLSVSKETYERLGLIGQKLPFKHQVEQYVIRFPLQKHAETVTNRKRRDEALKAWDGRREKEGLGPWTLVYASKDGSNLPGLDAELRNVPCQCSKTTNVRIPEPSLRSRPSTSAEDAEDWDADMVGLFEWVGMAGLHSQRLKAYDRVDPYVAVYESPAPSYIGDITHLRWEGLLHPDFVQSILDIGIATLKMRAEVDPARKPFIAIASHAISASPVSYISQTANAVKAPSMRLPRAGGEDTWCLFVTPACTDSAMIGWSLLESVGQYDTRWG